MVLRQDGAVDPRRRGHGAAPVACTLPPAVMAQAARCWRRARDRRDPVQQRLYALLAPLGYEMLAPVLDSVMTLGETCLGRPLCQGCPLSRDGDAALLCALLADPARLDRLACCRARDGAHARALRRLFAGALVSAGVMATMA